MRGEGVAGQVSVTRDPSEAPDGPLVDVAGWLPRGLGAGLYASEAAREGHRELDARVRTLRV